MLARGEMIFSPKGLMIYHVCDLDKKILQKIYPFLQYFLERITGLEPATSTLARSRSTK